MAASTLGQPLGLAHVCVGCVRDSGVRELTVRNQGKLPKHAGRRVEWRHTMRTEQFPIHLALSLLEMKAAGNEIVVVTLLSAGLARADRLPRLQHIPARLILEHNGGMGQFAGTYAGNRPREASAPPLRGAGT